MKPASTIKEDLVFYAVWPVTTLLALVFIGVCLTFMESPNGNSPPHPR